MPGRLGEQFPRVARGAFGAAALAPAAGRTPGPRLAGARHPGDPATSPPAQGSKKGTQPAVVTSPELLTNGPSPRYPTILLPRTASRALRVLRIFDP